MVKTENLVGQKFGRLTVIEEAPKRGTYTMWRCRCDCGNESFVRGSSLKNGHTKSCGCYHSDIVRSTMTKHGMYKSRLYRIYQHMIHRCNAPKENGYENYGGRGISVYKEWMNDFKTFLDWAMDNGYQDNLSIDRIDVDGDYCPQNCRWASYREQANNTRANHILMYDGKRYTMSELAEAYKIPYNLLDSRIFRGWDVKTAVETPVNKNLRRYKA